MRRPYCRLPFLQRFPLPAALDFFASVASRRNRIIICQWTGYFFFFLRARAKIFFLNNFGKTPASLKILNALRKWCSGRDLNPHAFRHTPLKRTCLPFHHPSLRRLEAREI